MPVSDVTTAKPSKRRPVMPKAATAAAKVRRGPVAEAMLQAAKPAAGDAGKRRLMVAEAAYYLAEKRAFAPGGELQDWLEAEAAIELRYPA
jgi:hypothetical protein